MKERSNQLALFAVFILPLLVILASPSFNSLAMNLNQPSARVAAGPTVAKFYSMGGLYDGWVLESGEFTGVGGSMNTTGSLVFLGDDKANRQYRGILSFNTNPLPPHATIVGATVGVDGNGVVGINPFSFARLNSDIIRGVYGRNKLLQLIDFQAASSLNNAGGPARCVVTGWCTFGLSSPALAFINTSGLTQIRLRFTPDDNNNKKADYYKIYSGDSLLKGTKPYLQVSYYP